MLTASSFKRPTYICVVVVVVVAVVVVLSALLTSSLRSLIASRSNGRLRTMPPKTQLKVVFAEWMLYHLFVCSRVWLHVWLHVGLQVLIVRVYVYNFFLYSQLKENMLYKECEHINKIVLLWYIWCLPPAVNALK